MRLYLTVRPVPPRYQATPVTVGDYIAVLPAGGRKWRKHTADNAWTLRLAALTLGSGTLEDVWFSFIEDNLAAPSDAASCRVIRAAGQRIGEEASLALTRAVLALARNSL